MSDKNQQWLIASYEPVCLFSLRMSQTTSKGGKTLVIPTPYSIKMALVDACFRAWGKPEAFANARRVFDIVKARRIHFLPPKHCVVQNTFVKVLDAERGGELPFKQTIVYREFVAFSGGPLQIAIDLTGCSSEEIALVERLFWHINSIGKRGSFWQCTNTSLLRDLLPVAFSTPLEGGQVRGPDQFGMVQALDDFGEALCTAKDGFERVSTYSDGVVTLGKHRVLMTSAIPYRRRSAGKRFTWYERSE